MEEIARGAEAVIYRDKDKVVKKRLKKGYRIERIDHFLRKSRTTREKGILEKLEEAGLPAPKLIEGSDYEFTMEFVDGARLSEHLNEENYGEIMEEAGEVIAELHEMDIAHGDLTTSNMIMKEKVYLIDFGLSLYSQKIEDRAMDLHLLKEALEAKHYPIWEKSFEAFKKGYKKYSEHEKVLERMKAIEKRGRYK